MPFGQQVTFGNYKYWKVAGTLFYQILKLTTSDLHKTPGVLFGIITYQLYWVKVPKTAMGMNTYSIAVMNCL